MHKQVVVSVKDLRFPIIRCASCNTRVTLDFATEFEARAGRQPFNAPPDCPRCGTRFDSAVCGAVNAMQKAYKALVELGDTVSFTGDLEAGE